MQYGYHPHLGVQLMFWVLGKGIQCFPCRGKQYVVHQFLILITDGTQLCRYGKYHFYPAIEKEVLGPIAEVILPEFYQYFF